MKKIFYLLIINLLKKLFPIIFTESKKRKNLSFGQTIKFLCIVFILLILVTKNKLNISFEILFSLILE